MATRLTSLLASFALATIPQAMVYADDPIAGEFVVTPQQAELVGPLDRVQLVVSDVEGDRVIDRTRDVRYESQTPDVADVSPTGLVRPVGDGEALIRVLLADQIRGVQIRVREQQAVPSFRNDVLPVFNRSGCSGGACHAAQYGQGGLKLSLLGFAPEDDFPQVARHREQRRISPIRPAESLLLQKATLVVSHGGGRRFRVDSHEYSVLRAWIAAGAPGPIKQEREVVDLLLSPEKRTYRPRDTQQLRVVARYSDGTAQDVTNRAMYDSMSDAVAKVTPDGFLRAVGGGQTPIMVRYMGQAKVSMVIVPYRDEVDLAQFQPRNFIDQWVTERWKQLGLEPSPDSTDEQFVRRVYLDAIGTLPPPRRVLEFVASADPNKRESLVDELLGLTGDPARDIHGNEWSAYWALKWGDLIRNNRNDLGDGGMWALYNWMRASLRQNKPVDQFVRELITARGSVFEVGPANYYKITNKPDELAEATAQNFLGVRLMCAKCHHHPFEVYSQSDYYGLAAFFTRVATKSSADFGALGNDTVVLVKRTGSIRHPRTNETMKPTPLLGRPLESEADADPRRSLADWLTAPDNRLFARNIVNRFWGYLMGTGLVEPIDDMRATNPPTNPELLDALATDFVANGYDLRRLMRLIMTSRVYGLSSRPTQTNGADTRFYTHYNVKRLPAEVLLDALGFATATSERFPGIPAGTRAIELPDPNYASYFLDTMGRPKRVVTCECERTSQPNLAQVLHVANGEVLSRKIADPAGRVAKLVGGGFPDEAVISELYLVTLSRPPTADEVARCQTIMGQAPRRSEGVEDVLWALTNSREFLFNH